MIPTWTRIQLDSYEETSVSFSPQQKHRIADDNKKKGGLGDNVIIPLATEQMAFLSC